MRNLYFLLFLSNFFMVSCSTPSVQSIKNLPSKESNTLVTKEEHEWMEKFFKEFFLGGASIYTLFGTKPISAEMLIFATEEECQQSTLRYLEKEGIKGKEREEALSLSMKCFREDDFSKNWEKWISFFNQYPKTPFLFAKHPTLSEKVWSGHIANVQETIWTLQKHYDLFKKELGFDFDPVSVTMDFKNEDSDFWKQVFSNHLLTGIVYGFGYKNSYFFDLLMKLENSSETLSPPLTSKTQGRSKGSFLYTLADLRLPRFRSFETLFNEDPVLEKYKLERKMIRDKLNDSNFFKMVFLQLTGELPNENNAKKIN